MALKPLTKLLPTLCVCVPVVWLCSKSFFGGLLPEVALVTLVGLAWSGIHAWERPADRPWWALSAGMILVALLIPASVQWHYRVAARRAADATAGVVERFRQEHGRYPLTLGEVGPVRENAWEIRYRFSNNRPVLSYADTTDMFAWYYYDFDRHRWRRESM